MNKFLLSSLLAVPFCWVACSKNADIPPERESEEEMVELSFSANASPMTKADGTSDDGIIHSLDIFIFNYSQDSDGCLEAYGFYTPETSSFSTVMKISKGVKGVYAVANAPDGLLDDVTSIHSYEDVLWQFSQNSRESLVMHGDTEILITGDTYDVDVSLERYVCKMVVESITNKLPPQYGDLQIKGIYLDYVPRNVEDEDQFWRLSDGDLTTDVESMMTGSGAMSIPYGETVNLSSCVMYGFPNNASESYQYNIKVQRDKGCHRDRDRRRDVLLPGRDTPYRCQHHLQHQEHYHHKTWQQGREHLCIYHDAFHRLQRS